MPYLGSASSLHDWYNRCSWQPEMEQIYDFLMRAPAYPVNERWEKLTDDSGGGDRLGLATIPY